MTIALREQSGSDSSYELLAVSEPRFLEIDQKQRLVAEFLESHGYDALLLQQPWNFAWFTAGGDNTRDGQTDTCAALFINADARVILASNVDSSWIFETQVRRLGFQLKERHWQEAPERLLEDLCRGRNVASDTGFNGTRDVSEELLELRLPMSYREQASVRALGLDLAHIVERSAAKTQRGQTECDVAGAVLHRLLLKQIQPVSVQVTADQVRAQHPHAHSSVRPVDRLCSISIVGRREGICVAVRRTVSFGPPDEDTLHAFQTAAMIHATGICFSRAEWEVEELWPRVRRIYEKFGFADDWRHSEQSEIIAHRPREIRVVPRNPFRLSPGMAIHWHPLVAGMGLGDTILVTPLGRAEFLTRTGEWPELQIEVKGEQYACPGLPIV